VAASFWDPVVLSSTVFFGQPDGRLSLKCRTASTPLNLTAIIPGRLGLAGARNDSPCPYRQSERRNWSRRWPGYAFAVDVPLADALKLMPIQRDMQAKHWRVRVSAAGFWHSTQTTPVRRVCFRQWGSDLRELHGSAKWRDMCALKSLWMDIARSVCSVNATIPESEIESVYYAQARFLHENGTPVPATLPLSASILHRWLGGGRSFGRIARVSGASKCVAGKAGTAIGGQKLPPSSINAWTYAWARRTAIIGQRSLGNPELEDDANKNGLCVDLMFSNVDGQAVMHDGGRRWQATGGVLASDIVSNAAPCGSANRKSLVTGEVKVNG